MSRDGQALFSLNSNLVTVRPGLTPVHVDGTLDMGDPKTMAKMLQDFWEYKVSVPRERASSSSSAVCDGRPCRANVIRVLDV